MNKKHSDIEMFLRKMMLKLGLGFQCYYKNNAKNRRRQGYNGKWSIEIWDQRNGHYTKKTLKKDGPSGFDEHGFFHWNYNTSPSQKWYNNQNSDTRFDIVGPSFGGNGVDHKDDFLWWLLEDWKLLEKIGEKIKDFEGGSLYGISIMRTLKGEKDDKLENTLIDLIEEFDKLKEKRNETGKRS